MTPLSGKQHQISTPMAAPDAQAPPPIDPKQARYLTKNRIVAVDILRILAALVVLYYHATSFVYPSPYRLITALPTSVFYHGSMVFMILSGYFACREVTWKKACYNAWWCFAPLVVWNIVQLAVTGNLTPAAFQPMEFFGAKSFFIQQIGPWTFGEKAVPPSGALWFMRDLTLLFLLSPILYKYARYIFPTCLVLSICPYSGDQFAHLAETVLCPEVITFFTAGCFLRTFSKDAQKKALAYCCPWLLILFITCMVFFKLIVPVYFQSLTNHSFFDDCAIVALISTWMLYQLARFIELKLPFLIPYALKLAPVTFLTFAGHTPIYYLLLHSPWGHSRALAFTLPILVFILMAALFFTLKRWCRPLLHLVAHYKLRPDDYPPANHHPTSETTAQPGRH